MKWNVINASLNDMEVHNDDLFFFFPLTNIQAMTQKMSALITENYSIHKEYESITYMRPLAPGLHEDVR